MTGKHGYRIEGLTKTFGAAVKAADNINLEIAPGELIVLLGPSGCGKTTTMRCIAGFESGNAGRITFGERCVFDAARAIDVPPEQRNVGMVFQSYALWPHKTVRENIAYPLQVRKMRQALTEGWVEDVARIVECTPLLDRYPGQLSGGQQQRVALARGLVARPDLMLFDEPLSNLDALLRAQVRNDLHELHHRLKFAGVYVTHDQAEAFAIGDRVAVMRAGRIEQIGKPPQIYEAPYSEYVANFVGMTNCVALTRDGEAWRTAEATRVMLPDEAVGRDRLNVRFRPAAARVVSAEEPHAGLRLSGLVADAVYVGGAWEVSVLHGTQRIGAMASRAQIPNLSPQAPVLVEIPWDLCALFDEDGLRAGKSS